MSVLSFGGAMRRRDVITLLGSAAVAWPLGARAQQAALPVVGFMSGRSAPDSVHLVAAFREGLSEAGFVDGQNVIIEFRWANGQYDQLPALAAQLVSRPVTVLVGVGGDPSAIAAKRATSTIPIVFGMGGDPIKAGLVDSFNRPGTNLTGLHAVWTNEIEVQTCWSAARARARRCPHWRLAQSKICARSAAIAANRECGADGRPEARHRNRKHRRGIERCICVARSRAGQLALLVAADPYFDTRRDQIIVFSRRKTGCRRFIIFANLPRREDCSVMVRASPMATARPGTTPVRFSRAPSPAICRCCSRPNLKW